MEDKKRHPSGQEPEAEHPSKKVETQHEEDGKKSEWEDFLNRTTVKDVLREVKKDEGKELLVLDPKTNLEDALHKLKERDVLSAPLVHPLTHEVLGFIDVLDISSFVLDTWHKKTNEFQSRISKARDYAKQCFFESHVEDVQNFSGVDPVVKVNEGDNLRHLFHVFAKPSRHKRLHRVAVVKNERLTNILSQSDLIAFFSARSELLPLKLASRTLDEIHIVHPPLMMRLDSPFDSALEFLAQNRISGIALVDDQARISGNFSASDLRGLNQQAFKFFTGSILQFMVKGTDTGLIGPISCPRSSTIGEVLSLLTTNRVHRVYTVSDLSLIHI
eukprot:TRINITY_DN3759_c0_g1_i1.p1 TRINITY_DN3759_c0_g1~~TRINITY_DN3759_c0_g1_i1.p1  ORF type:complete len:331 (-),score=90.81 TRINITY_DN3759_c0_g1_i1:35-1027(-)